MRGIEKAISSWSGAEITLSMFAVFGTDPKSELSFVLDPVPIAIRKYLLEDDVGFLKGRVVWEYDFVFAKMPENLEKVLRESLETARAGGAHVAWFGFEGSFDYEFLLTPEIASQIYAIVDETGVRIASDDMLWSEDWKNRLAHAGQSI